MSESTLSFCKIDLFHQHQHIFFGWIGSFLSVAGELSVGCCYGSNWGIVIMLCTHFLGKLVALLWAHAAVMLSCCHAGTCHVSRATELPASRGHHRIRHPAPASWQPPYSQSLPPDLRPLCRVQIAGPLLFGSAIKHILSALYSL